MTTFILRGRAWLGEARQGLAGQVMEAEIQILCHSVYTSWCGRVWRGLEWRGLAWQGEVRSGLAWHDSVRQGKVWQEIKSESSAIIFMLNGLVRRGLVWLGKVRSGDAWKGYVGSGLARQGGVCHGNAWQEPETKNLWHYVYTSRSGMVSCGNVGQGTVGSGRAWCGTVWQGRDNLPAIMMQNR